MIQRRIRFRPAGGGGGGGGGAASTGPNFAPREPTQRSDAPKPKLLLVETTQRGDESKFKFAPVDTTNRADQPTLVLVKKLPESVSRTDLGKATMVLQAVPRSLAPDADTWGDAWTDATVGQTGVNHGNSNPLSLDGTAVTEKRAFIKIDLRGFTSLTASGNSHPLILRAVTRTSPIGNAINFACQGQTGNPFTESTITQSGQPATPTAITRELSGLGAGPADVTVTFTDAEMNQLLGKWALIVLTTNISAAWSVNSREAATKNQLTFTANTQ